MGELTGRLDELASLLEEKGLSKYASRLDVVSNSIEAASDEDSEQDSEESDKE